MYHPIYLGITFPPISPYHSLHKVPILPSTPSQTTWRSNLLHFSSTAYFVSLASKHLDMMPTIPGNWQTSQETYLEEHSTQGPDRGRMNQQAVAWRMKKLPSNTDTAIQEALFGESLSGAFWGKAVSSSSNSLKVLKYASEGSGAGALIPSCSDTIVLPLECVDRVVSEGHG